MIESVRDVCAAVRHTLDQTPYPNRIEAWDDVVRIAKDNGLSGMIYATVCRVDDTRPACRMLRKEHYVYVATAAKQDETLADLKRLLAGEDIPHIFLKGSMLRQLYPDVHMRSMGDIDVLVSKEAMARIHILLEQHHYDNPLNGPTHDLFTHRNGVTVEVHPHLAHAFDGHPVPLFDQVWDHTLVTDTAERRLEPDFELVYLIYHLAKHVKSSGIGLRSVLDIGLYVEHHRDQINLDTVQSMLQEIDYLRFGQSILWMTKDWFHLPSMALPFPPLDPDLMNTVTRFVATSGVHGKGSRFNRELSTLGTSSARFPKLDRLCRLTFPPRAQLVTRYRFLSTSPLLYPIAWFLRIVRILFRSTKRIRHLLRRMTLSNDDIQQAASMFQKLGL